MLLQNENKLVSQQCNQRGARCDELPSCNRAQLDPNTHLQMWHSSHTIRMGTKTSNEELPSAPVLGFTEAEFHAALSGCWWFIPPPAFKKGSAFPRAPQKCREWSGPSPGLGEGGVRKSMLQLQSDQTATNYSSRRDVCT